jgi:hypothetical protein
MLALLILALITATVSLILAATLCLVARAILEWLFSDE